MSAVHLRSGGKVIASRRGSQVTVGGRTVELVTAMEAEYLMAGIEQALIEQTEIVGETIREAVRSIW